MDRWASYSGGPASVTAGWTLSFVAGPSRLGGANGIVFDPVGHELMVTQVFGSQVTAIDVDSGSHRSFAPLDGGIAGPDDGVFGSDGTFFATEPMNATVSARNPDGTYRTLRDDLPSINGITMDRGRRRLFADEFRPGGSLWELDPAGERPPRHLAGDLDMPNALAVGPDGALWFPQVIAGEIWRYDLDDGSLRRVFTDLASPCAVKFDSTGRLVTPQSGSGEVTRIDITTGFRETIAHVARGIDNIALAPDDRLFISHFTDGRVVEWASGAERLLSDSGLLGPYGIAVLPDGSVVFADGLSVGRIGADGTIERTHTLLSDLPTLAVGIGVLDGDPVVAGARGQVIRCRAGERGVPIGGRLTDPAAITSDGAGSVLVVERSAGRVTRLNPDGTTESVMAGLHRPAAAAIDDDGLLWVACTDALVAIKDAEVVQRIPELAGALGCAVGPDGLLVAHPPTRTLRLVRPGRSIETLVDNAPIAAAVVGAELPYASAPVAAGAGGFLVGCVGDGSIRRLAPC